ncbi:unnamed protein product, partial [Nesidiocoris tenuis]
MDAGYSWDLKDEDAYEIARRAIYTATYRDAASGGLIRGIGQGTMEGTGRRIGEVAQERGLPRSSGQSGTRNESVHPSARLTPGTQGRKKE